TNDVDENRVLSGRKFVHPFRPKRNGESDEQHGLDQNAGKFQMGRDAAAHAGVIGFGMAALVETDQNENEKDRPTYKKRTHEPMREFENVIDLVAMLRSIRRLAKKFVDQCQAIHRRPSPRSIVRAAGWAFARVAKS